MSTETASTSRKFSSWDAKEDEDFVLHFINEIEKGAKATQAFKVAAEMNGNRTQAACAFRWNSTLSKNPENKEMYEKAKQVGQGKLYVPSIQIEFKRKKESEVVETQNSDLEIQQVSYDDDVEKAREFVDSISNIFSQQNARQNELEQQLEKANQEIERLTKRNEELENDVKAFSNIFNRARQLAVSEEFPNPAPASFKMDRNGNLERT